MDGDLIGLIIAVVISMGAGLLGKAGKVAKEVQHAPHHSAPHNAPHPQASPFDKEEKQSVPDPFKTLKDILGEIDPDEKREQDFEPEAQSEETMDEVFEESKEQNAYQSQRTPTRTPSADYIDDLGNKIYDYEAESLNESSKTQLKPQMVEVAETNVAEEPYNFDLRQAVISQTILQNQYVSDWK
jgi:hypothetical protein